MLRAPRLIGIGGPSGAGKTTLARHLASLLPGSTHILALDSYYRDLSCLPPDERPARNFDAPAALDHKLLACQLRELAQGRGVDRPVYSFASHTRAPQSERVNPADQVIAEGLFALYWEEIRGLLHARIYVEAPDQACLERRLARDVVERGRDPESARAQYAHSVRPMAALYVLPSRRFADWVVDGQAPVEESTSLVLAGLQSRPRGRTHPP